MNQPEIRIGPEACRQCKPYRLCRWCANEQERRGMIERVCDFFRGGAKIPTRATELRRHLLTVHRIATRISGKRSAQPPDAVKAAINEWANHYLA